MHTRVVFPVLFEAVVFGVSLKVFAFGTCVALGVLAAWWLLSIQVRESYRAIATSALLLSLGTGWMLARFVGYWMHRSHMSVGASFSAALVGFLLVGMIPALTRIFGNWRRLTLMPLSLLMFCWFVGSWLSGAHLGPEVSWMNAINATLPLETGALVSLSPQDVVDGRVVSRFPLTLTLAGASIVLAYIAGLATEARSRIDAFFWEMLWHLVMLALVWVYSAFCGNTPEFVFAGLLTIDALFRFRSLSTIQTS